MSDSSRLRDPRDARLRYVPLVKLASGGMATVYVGALRGDLAFRQLVAIKRPHPHLVEDPELRDELLAEARLASRIHHANVVDVRDVELVGDSVQLVMDYVEGASLGELILLGAKTGRKIPHAVAVRVALDACAGLHAAHELADEAGAPLGIVHRDVSPQNILVGLDGVARVADFGVAKEALSNKPRTTTGTLKGKIGYLAPEYVRGKPVDRRADVFALGVVLWEALTHKRLFRASNEAEALERVLREEAPPPSAYAPELGTALDLVLARALEKAPERRWPRASDLAEALEAAARPGGLVATHAEVAEAITAAVGDEIAARRKRVSEALLDLESRPSVDEPRPPPAVVPKRDGSRGRRALALVALAAVLSVAVGVAVVRRASAPDTASVSTDASPARAPPTPVGESAVEAAASPPLVSAAPAVSTRAIATPSQPVSSASPPRRAPKPLPPNPYR